MFRKVDDLGRVVIPKEIRDKYNLRYGDELKITVKNRKIIFEKEDEDSYECTNCQQIIDIKDNYCRYCGEEVM